MFHREERPKIAGPSSTSHPRARRACDTLLLDEAVQPIRSIPNLPTHREHTPQDATTRIRSGRRRPGLRTGRKRFRNSSRRRCPFGKTGSCQVKRSPETVQGIATAASEVARHGRFFHPDLADLPVGPNAGFIGKLCERFESILNVAKGFRMGSTADRTLFTGTAYLHGAGGSRRPFSYRGSYSKPRRDRQGCVRFGWTATVEGVDKQPQPRTTIVDEAGGVLAADFVEARIRRSIEEHLAVFAGEAGVKIR